MNPFTALEGDTYLDKFNSQDTETRQQSLKAILDYADAHPEELKAWTLTNTPGQLSPLDVVYEALMQEPDRWGDYIATEYARILEGAKKSVTPFAYTACLDSTYCFTQWNSPFVKKIIALLANELDNPIDAIRHRAVSLLTIWIDKENQADHRDVLLRIKEKLHDQNWKIRWIAHFGLKGYYGFDDREIHQSLADKLRGKFFLLGNPMEIKDPK